MSNLVIYAEKELDIIGMTADSPDEMNRAMRENVLSIVKMFADQGHSGFSASYCTGLVTKLMAFEPLTPLTGEDNEWTSVAEKDGEPWYQNKRCSHVFKDKTGAYDNEGKVFYDVLKNEDGSESKSYFTSSLSRVYIEFPYTPKKEYLPNPDNK